MGKLQLIKLGYCDDLINKEIQVAINTTIKRSLRNNWCLCHGDKSCYFNGSWNCILKIVNCIFVTNE